MKKTTIILFSIFAIFCNQQAKAANSEIEYQYTRNLNVFSLRSLWWKDFDDRSVLFVSLSDIDRINEWSEEPEPAEFPDLNGWELEALRFFELSGKYRRCFLTRTGISETDSVFIFNYAADVLLTFPVNELRTAAMLDFWVGEPEFCRTQPCSLCDFHIGFEIRNDDYLISRRHTLVYIGKTHPFVRGGMRVMVWERINSEDFPLEKSNPPTLTDDDNCSRIAWAFVGLANRTRGDAFLFETEYFKFFVQNIPYPYPHHWISDRHLLVIDKKTEKVILERAFLALQEMGSVYPLNFGIDSQYNYEGHTEVRFQWTGNLFRGKPPIVLGFERSWCDDIMFLDPTMDDMWIWCDNRY